MNNIAPHQTVIKITTQTFEQLSDGKLKPPPANQQEFIFSIVGKDYDDCSNKLESFINHIRQIKV